MKTIKAVPYEGEKQARICSVTGKPFVVDKGQLVYSMDEKHVSGEVAQRVGFEIHPDVKPPEGCNTKVKLGEWLLNDLGLPRSSPQYMQMYMKYSPLFEYGK
ncbi:MAG: hypothetical protein V2B15_04660 [Bacteroidota bacterium]